MKVLIVDDHPVARRGLRIIISEAFSGAICEEASDPSSALDLAPAFQPDLLLIDIHMPGEPKAPELCRQIREMLPGSRIVIVTAFDSSGEIRDCLVAGADGCLLKDTSETDMAEALRTAVSGGSALDARVAFRLARDLASGSANDSGGNELSRRQQEVLRLLAEGRSNRSIAQLLGLSEATVKGHVSRLMDKLNASSRLEAVVRAADAGLLLAAAELCGGIARRHLP